MTGPLFAVTLATALACGLIAGVFFAFSSFVMRALAALPPAHGIAAMQSINRVVLNPLFLVPFTGAALAGAGLVVAAVLGADGAPWLAAGGALYALGTFGVTVAFNVPRNEALAALDPHAPEAADAWDRYVREWTAANHVRTAAALAAAGMLTVALS